MIGLKLILILIPLLIIASFAVYSSENDLDLETNCFAPQRAVFLLRTLRTRDWSQLDRQSLQALWPTKFRVSEDCEVHEDGLVYPCALMSAGFCLENVCYCNIAFDLKTGPGNIEKLNRLTIFYSERDLEKVITAGQLFVSALDPLIEKYSSPKNGWQLDETKHLSKMFGYYPNYSYREGNTVYSGSDFGVQLDVYTLENGISSVYLTLSDPEELRPPN